MAILAFDIVCAVGLVVLFGWALVRISKCFGVNVLEAMIVYSRIVSGLLNRQFKNSSSCYYSAIKLVLNLTVVVCLAYFELYITAVQLVGLVVLAYVVNIPFFTTVIDEKTLGVVDKYVAEFPNY